jgi:methionyl-tRNA formyltransferase
VRLIIHGQQAFGKAVLENLLARGEEVACAYCAPDVIGGRVDPLSQGYLFYSQAPIRIP